MAGSWPASSTSTGGIWSSTRVHQAFRALGRLLLAEPEDELAEVRERILAAVGPNAGLLTAMVPEFAALLAVPPGCRAIR